MMRGLGWCVAALFAHCAQCPLQDTGPSGFHPKEWAPKKIHFGGLDWDVREGKGLAGAGPNHWSSTPDAVHVDAQGTLWLSLTRTPGGDWASVELSTPLPDGPLRIDVDLATALTPLPPDVIAAIFVCRNDVSEFDLEFGRWGKETRPNLQYVVAPTKRPGNAFRVELLDLGKPSKHRFRWTARQIVFSTESAGGRIQWRYRGPDVPPLRGHRLHLNLWILKGRRTSEEPATLGFRAVQLSSP